MADIQTIDQYSDPELFFRTIRDSLEMIPGLNLTVRGWSMAPVIKDADNVLLERIDSRDVKKGDIVFFKDQNSRFICHRVIDKKLLNQEEIFITKGDVSLFIDVGFTASRILGVVRKLNRRGKTIELEKNLFYRLIGFLNVKFAKPVIGITFIVLRVKNSLARFLQASRKGF